MNVKLLLEKIAASNFDRNSLAAAAGMSRTSLYRKIIGKRQFKADEIAILSELLALSLDDIKAIFFNPKVS